jgi:hypothetical protein
LRAGRLGTISNSAQRGNDDKVPVDFKQVDGKAKFTAITALQNMMNVPMLAS